MYKYLAYLPKIAVSPRSKPSYTVVVVTVLFSEPILVRQKPVVTLYVSKCFTVELKLLLQFSVQVRFECPVTAITMFASGVDLDYRETN